MLQTRISSHFLLRPTESQELGLQIQPRQNLGTVFERKKKKIPPPTIHIHQMSGKKSPARAGSASKAEVATLPASLNYRNAVKSGCSGATKWRFNSPTKNPVGAGGSLEKDGQEFHLSRHLIKVYWLDFIIIHRWRLSDFPVKSAALPRQILWVSGHLTFIKINKPDKPLRRIN